MDPLEKWQTFDRNDPRVWADVLWDMGVDSHSQEELFALAQRDDRGWQDANDSLGKLLKCKCSGKQLNNPSAYLHSMVLEKRHKYLAEQGTYP